MKKLEEVINKILCQYPEEIYFGKSQLETLKSKISMDSRFDIFFNHIHVFGGGSGASFNNELEFPRQVMNRAKEVGARQTLKEISNYIESSVINIEYALLLYSIHIDREFRFSNGVRLISLSHLNDTKLISFLNKEQISTGSMDTSLLIHDFVTQKEFYSIISGDKKSTDFSKIRAKDDLIKILDDTRFMLSLGRNLEYGIPVVGSFEVIPDDLHFFNSGTTYSNFSEPITSAGPEITESELNRADELLKKFNSLSSNNKAKIRIAVKRLNDSKIDSNWVNKSINLRICLENLFCGENETGIAQTISERASIHTNFSKTRARKVYRFLSVPVHRGIPPEHQTITVEEITSEVHKTIIKFIEEGRYPVWPKKETKGKLHQFIKCIKNIFNCRM